MGGVAYIEGGYWDEREGGGERKRGRVDGKERGTERGREGGRVGRREEERARERRKEGEGENTHVQRGDLIFFHNM